ncbi:MAG: glutamate 5-kinase [Pontixanthobacter sp.]
MEIEHLKDFRDPKKCKRLVIKIGSALLVDKAGKIRTEWLASVAQEIADALKEGQEIVVVSSGAVALGAARLGLSGGGRETIADAQAAAAVGQIQLSAQWSSLLANHGVTAAQLLLTLDDLEGRRRYLNASSTVTRLLRAGAVPIINENDSIAVSEIRFGDNDRLAARVAQACNAQGVLLLSDIDGLYTRHPDEPGAEHLPRVRGVTEEMHDMASGSSGSGMGSGGMTSKLLAAQIAERAGIALAIIDGSEAMPIRLSVAANSGTVFLPKRDDSAYKAWIGGRLRFNGALVVDDGCIAALRDGRSLLAVGIVDVKGDFERGDVIRVEDQSGRMLAKGMIEYDSAESMTIMGLANSEHAALLGHAPRSAVIHRDQLVLL